MPLTLKDASGQDVQLPTSEEIAEMITGATKRQIETSNKKLTETILATVGESVKSSLDQYEQARAEKPAPAPGAEPPTARPSPEMAALQKRLEDAEKAIKTANDARIEAETKQRNESARAAITSLLGPTIRPEALKVITDHLFANSVDFDDAGTPLFKSRKASMPGMPEEDVRLPLDVGVREFLKSKEAEWLIPTRPQTTQKPGVRMPQGPLATQQYDKPAATEDEKIRRAMEREQLLKAQGVGV